MSYRNIVCLQVSVSAEPEFSTPLLADMKCTLITPDKLDSEQLEMFHEEAKKLLDKFWDNPTIVRDENEVEHGGVRAFLTEKLPFVAREDYNYETNNSYVGIPEIDYKVTFEFYSETDPSYVPSQIENIGNNSNYDQRTQIYRVMWEVNEDGKSGVIKEAEPVLYGEATEGSVFYSFFREGEEWK